MTDAHQPSRSLPSPPLDPAARERVVEVLSRHFADDRISAEDLEVHLERVYRATTAAQLDAVIADLPESSPAGASLAVRTEQQVAQRISALLSGQEQRMTGVVPPRLEVRSRLGYVELDLTRATFAPGVTEIDVRALLGYVQIRFPAGVRVECLGQAVLGFFSLKGASRSGGEDAPSIVRIAGRATLGFAECFIAKAKSLPPGSDAR